MAKANLSMIKPKSIKNNTNKNIIYNFNIMLVFSLMVIKFYLAGVRQLLAGALFGGHLHMLHPPGRER